MFNYEIKSILNSIFLFAIHKSLGYKAIVIGDKGFKNKDIDPMIYEWLK